MNDNKILSVIIPSYNMEAYLPKCIGSLLVDDAALMQSLDIVIVNDGSKDRTSEIAHEFAERFPGTFQVIDKENGHYGSCINAALPLLRGTFVKILDADDWVDTENFRNLLNHLASYQSKNLPDAIVADYNQVNPDGQVTRHVHYGFKVGTFCTPDETLSMSKEYIGIHALIVRTEHYQDSDYRQLEGLPYTDVQFSLGAIARIKSVDYLPMPITQYLVGRNGQTMEPAIFIRDLPKYITVAKHVIDDYTRICPVEGGCSNKYYCYYVENLVREIYNIYTFGRCGLFPSDSGKDFDLFVKDRLPRFYDAIGDEFRSRNIRFHYIREWRKHYDNKSWKFRMFNLYNGFAVNISSLLLRYRRQSCANGR